MAPDARQFVATVIRFEISDPPLKFQFKFQTGVERRRFCFALFCFVLFCFDRNASPARSSPRQDGEKMPAGR